MLGGDCPEDHDPEDLEDDKRSLNDNSYNDTSYNDPDIINNYYVDDCNVGEIVGPDGGFPHKCKNTLDLADK